MLALKAENISKQYRLGQVGTGTLSHDLNRFWHRVRGKEDPYLKIGEANDRSTKGESEYVWSLRDINFEIEQGDAVGIIGRNGAGKSTLLKLLSKVTKPTTGKMYTKGRVASLLEVGTGFHPEMTGRENIYLNGAILGMTRKEITRKFDEIVDFSGVERYIDTPVKRYSSGMYVRLAFAVAAHLESEILIIDEVLAVGDAEFQKKCLGKMNDVSKGEGRTILFVSHQMGSIATLCKKGIFLENGKLISFGKIDDIIEKYTMSGISDLAKYIATNHDKSFFVESCELLRNNIQCNEFLNNDTATARIILKNKDKVKNALFSFTLQSSSGDYLTTFVKPTEELMQEKGTLTTNINFKCNNLSPNNFYLRLAIFNPTTGQVYDLQEMICPFKINNIGDEMARFEGINYGYFNLDYFIS
ncbi:MAG: polysaccharide ABC transporter ATP-binding protein [Flavobacteriales bacterium]